MKKRNVILYLLLIMTYQVSFSQIIEFPNGGEILDLKRNYLLKLDFGVNEIYNLYLWNSKTKSKILIPETRKNEYNIHFNEITNYESDNYRFIIEDKNSKIIRVSENFFSLKLIENESELSNKYEEKLLDNDEIIYAYPNPCNFYTKFKIDDTIKYEFSNLSDLAGKCFEISFEIIKENEFLFDTSNLPIGQYYFVFKMKGGNKQIVSSITIIK